MAAYGRVVGTFVTSRGAGPSGGPAPVVVAPFSLIRITPDVARGTAGVVVPQVPVHGVVDTDGVLHDEDGNEGVELLASDQGDGVTVEYVAEFAGQRVTFVLPAADFDLSGVTL